VKVLVTYATAHGSTQDIAARVAGRLREGAPRLAVDLAPVEDAPDPEAYDALVIGSAVHDQACPPAPAALGHGTGGGDRHRRPRRGAPPPG
jgi:menaquinone-dependent protoporphyrinogen oxidase